MKLREKYNTNDYILGKLTCGILSLFKDRKKLEEVRSFLWKDTWNLLELSLYLENLWYSKNIYNWKIRNFKNSSKE